MRADFDWHAAGDAAAGLMDVHDAALSHELSAAIEDTPYQRAARLTASMLASSHMRVLQGPIKSVRAVPPYRLPRSGGIVIPPLRNALQSAVVRVEKKGFRERLWSDTRRIKDMWVAFIVSALVARPVETLIGSALAMTGIPVYFWLARARVSR